MICNNILFITNLFITKTFILANISSRNNTNINDTINDSNSNFISLYTIKYSIGNTSLIVNNINKQEINNYQTNGLKFCNNFLIDKNFGNLMMKIKPIFKNFYYVRSFKFDTKNDTGHYLKLELETKRKIDETTEKIQKIISAR